MRSERSRLAGGLERSRRKDEGLGIQELCMRPARASDIGRIAQIEQECYSVPWSTHSFSALLARPRTLFEVAILRGATVVGYAIVWRVLNEAELANLAVGREFRGRGIGSALLDGAIEKARAGGVRSLFLEVRDSNDAALRLYSRRGFRQIALREHYYERPKEHARVLKLELVAPNEILPEGRR